MRPIKSLATVVLVAGIIMAVAQCGKNKKTVLRIFGSTTIEPYMKKATDAYAQKEKLSFIIKGIGSKDGIDSLIAGSCDIAMSSMEISTEQLRHAQQKGITIEVILLGYDAIIPIVHPTNKVADLTFEQLKEIYAGKIRRWSAVGGADTIIDVVERSGSSGTYAVWHHEMLPVIMPVESLTILSSNSAILSYLAERTNAIAYISSAYINPEVKPLKLNGVAIAENDSLLHEYHLKRPFYLYLNEKTITTVERSLIMFLVINEEGRKLLRQSGFYSGLSLEPLYKTVEKISTR